jgi:hypothetical protein
LKRRIVKPVKKSFARVAKGKLDYFPAHNGQMKPHPRLPPGFFTES